MKTHVLLGFTLCLLFVAAIAHATVYNIQESGSASIRPNGSGTPEWYSSNVNSSVSAVSTLPAGNPSSGYPLFSMSLFYFDLSAHAGKTVNGDGDLSIGLSWGENGGHMFDCYSIASSWNEQTVTWENLHGPDTTNNNPPYTSYPGNNQAFTNALGAFCSSTIVSNTSPYIYHWPIPAAVINEWLANPAANNHGVAVFGEWWANHIFCTRNRTWQNDRIPTLTVDIVPEPAAALVGFVALLLGLRRR